jgi:hypothetical protein
MKETWSSEGVRGQRRVVKPYRRCGGLTQLEKDSETELKVSCDLVVMNVQCPGFILTTQIKEEGHISLLISLLSARINIL